MKTLRFIGMAIVAIIMSVNFVACSDDDEEDNRPLAEKIIGHSVTSPLEKTVLTVNMIWTVQVTRRVLRNGK